MKLFLVDWCGGDNPESPESADVILELKKRGHGIVYWICESYIFKVFESKFPNTIFHDHWEALHAKPAHGIDIFEFIPPSKEIIEALYETESIILTMMNKRLEYLILTERKRLYYQMLRYWHGVLTKYAPDIIIIPGVPHGVYDYVIYGLAKYLNIKVIMFDTTQIDNIFVLLKDYIQGCVNLQKELLRTQNQRFFLSDLSNTLQLYYHEHVDSKYNPIPLSMVLDKKKYSGINLLKMKLKAFKFIFKDVAILKKGMLYFLKPFKANPKREYEALQIRPDLEKKFIYVPLSYQPECATIPLGGVFLDQILMIETLTAALPKGWRIYVKEHPVQWWYRGLNYFSYRYKGFYKDIAQLPNVYLIPINTNSRELIKKSQLVATPTGTTGWEAILQGKPAIIFGHPWYQDCPDLFKAHDVASCKLAIEKVVNGFKVNSETAIRFLVCLERTCPRGYWDEFNKSVSRLSSEENLKSITNALLKSIEEA